MDVSKKNRGRLRRGRLLRLAVFSLVGDGLQVTSVGFRLPCRKQVACRMQRGRSMLIFFQGYELGNA